MEVLHAARLDEIIKSMNFRDEEADRLEDQLLRNSLEYYSALCRLEVDALAGNGSRNIEELFYSKYYWFVKYKARYCLLFGYDAGLEQQGFKIISNYCEYFPGKIDWNIIEKIDNDLI